MIHHIFFLEFSITVGESTQRNYTTTLMVTSCKYWSKADNKWKDEGCVVNALLTRNQAML